LGGYAYLGAASCQLCSSITSRIEGRVLRKGGLLYSFRRAAGIRSRRPKVDLCEVQAVVNGEVVDKLVPYEQAPHFTIIRRFDTRPGILLGENYDPVAKPRWAIGRAANQKSKIQALGAKGFQETIAMGDSYERMIVKIAYCAAVGRVVLENLVPIANHLVLGEKCDIPYFLGEISREDCPGKFETLLSYSQHKHSRGYALSVQFRPFGGDIDPRYEAVVATMERSFAEIEKDGGVKTWRR